MDLSGQASQPSRIHSNHWTAAIVSSEPAPTKRWREILSDKSINKLSFIMSSRVFFILMQKQKSCQISEE